MSYLADAHSDWHAAHGRWGCPLDCAWSDPNEDPDAAEAAATAAAEAEAEATAAAAATAEIIAAATVTALTLIVHLCAERRSYYAIFAPGTDAVAAAFITDRGSYAAISVDDPGGPHNPLDGWPLTEAVLHPECEHGLSLALCAGPEHYPADL